MRLLFKLLGWAFDESGPKADRFHTIAVLGVAFDLSQSGIGRVCVANTEKRTNLVESLLAFAASGDLSKPDSLKLRGRVGFWQIYTHVKPCSLGV